MATAFDPGEELEHADVPVGHSLCLGPVPSPPPHPRKLQTVDDKKLYQLLPTHSTLLFI